MDARLPSHVLGGLVVAGAVAAVSLAAAPAPTRTLLASAPAHGAAGQVLGLTSVVLPPHSALPKHHHPGTQVATLTAGRLTYRVFSGAVPVYRNGVLVHTIRAGATYVLRSGDTLVEQPAVVHESSNPGGVPTRIMIASLFPKDAPPSIPVK